MNRYYRIEQLEIDEDHKLSTIGRYDIYDESLPEDLQKIHVEVCYDCIYISYNGNHVELSPNQFEALKCFPFDKGL